MPKKPFNLVLLGDPASGKATQAAWIAKRYHLYDFDMGKELRKPAARARYDYAGTVAVGKLAPTAAVRSILRRVIHAAPSRRGILFNGHPKMIGEAKLAALWLKHAQRADPLVIYLSIPEAETVARAMRRRRDDDAPKAIKNRRRYYEHQIARVVAFFRKKYAFVRISGRGSRARVSRRIAAAIGAYLKKNQK